MIYYLIPLLIVFYVICIKLYFNTARRYKIVDIPNKRSSHDYQTIRGGGVLFLFSGLIGFALMKDFPLYVFAGLVIISVVSFVDDVISLSSRTRMLFQVLSCVLLVTEFYHPILLWLGPILIILMLALINAYNFMDGINGMNGLYSLSFMLGMLGFYYSGFLSDSTLIISVICAILVFGFFNFRKKALCFSGDVGSVAMAFIVLFFLFLLCSKGVYVSILMLLVYGLDTFWTVVERALNKEKITEAHRKHLYQLLVNEKGYSHLSISIFYFVIQLIINAIILFIIKYNFNQFMFSGILLVLSSIVYLLLRTQLKKQLLSRNV